MSLHTLYPSNFPPLQIRSSILFSIRLEESEVEIFLNTEKRFAWNVS
ncbi:hypothetical protein LBBP_03496 [Leptospira borgpetersenii serovar Ballum]|uniref:Uncharacterized protein n=1 Tax=Leptospira borgpetersenii serovar Ballum TaxID=280505 RepID=A0A0S2IVI4_LEPBO|nr:hypothetical protein LBBP_03496 [Leptospira borgpetersenii serovar Ballum]